MRSYEELWDMPLGGTSTEKQIPHWLGNLAWVVVGAVFKICYRYNHTGREKLRAFHGKSGVVIVANHESFSDVAFLYEVCRIKQWLRFMCRENVFGAAHGLMGHIVSRCGAFPVKRDSADRVAIKRATKMLKRNEVVVILPEGTRRGKGSLEPSLHAGAAMVARMGKAPIIPVALRNVEKIKPKGERFHFPKVSVIFGDPILVSDFDWLPKEDRLDACTWYAMREVFAMKRGVRPEEVDMRELFPDDRDFSDVFANHEMPRHAAEELVADIEASTASKQLAAATQTKELPVEGETASVQDKADSAMADKTSFEEERER